MIVFTDFCSDWKIRNNSSIFGQKLVGSFESPESSEKMCHISDHPLGLCFVYDNNCGFKYDLDGEQCRQSLRVIKKINPFQFMYILNHM